MIKLVTLGPTTSEVDLCYLKEMHTDYVVSYGYRYRIKEPILSAYPNRLINQHISFLPWNRGADPNFWSIFDDTPKGITIHLIDEGLDTGPILVQREVEFDPDMTLRTSYNHLKEQMDLMWTDFWPDWIAGRIKPRKQLEGGSTHRKLEMLNHMPIIAPLGWDTPISMVAEYGRQKRSTTPVACQNGTEMRAHTLR